MGSVIKPLMEARAWAEQANEDMEGATWFQMAMMAAALAQAEALADIAHFQAALAASQEEATDALKRIASVVESFLVAGVPVERVP